MQNLLIKISIFFFLLFTCCILHAQKTKQDSLKITVAANKVDTLTIDANKQLSFFYQEDDPGLAIEYGLVAYQKSLLINDSFRTAQSSKAIGIAYDIKGNLDSALFYLKQALVIFTQIKRTDYQSHTLTDIAMAYYYKGNYELALRNHQAALQLRKALENNKFIAQSLLNIGLVYRSRKDYANAIKFYKQSYQIKKTVGDSTGMLNSLINTGAAFQSNGQFDSSYKYAYTSLQLAKTLASYDDVAATKENIAASLINLNRTGEALQYLNETDKDSAINKNKRRLLTHYESYGDLYLQQNNIELAQLYFTKALELAKSNNRLETMEVFYRKLSKCFYQQQKYKLAYDYYDLSKTISDTLLNEENSRQINEMSAVYETAEKESRIGALHTENEINLSEAKNRRTERNYFALATVLFIGLAGISYRAYTNNKKKKLMLDHQNKIIEKSLAEKEILLREIHHRVKNNLQIVSSLLSLQSNYIIDEQALDAVKESRNRVESMSLIHQNLYQEENLTGINVKQYIENLTENLFYSYNIKPDKIKLVKEIDTLILDVDTVIPIGLILNELITNCLKYAFINNNNGNIKVMLKEINSNLLLSVYDDGIGLPVNFKPGVKKSFGHKMINAFLQKLNGKMKMYSEDGTKVDIEIVNYQKI